MAKKFAINDIVIDRIQTAVAMNSAGEVLYTLNQLNNATIETTSESKEARDKDGTLIRKIYTGKSGTFTATNALLNVNVIAEGTGSAKNVATEAAPLNAPFIKRVKVGTESVEISGLKEDTVKVIGETADGAMVTTYTKDTAAGADGFAVAGGKISLPTDDGVGTFVITGERTITAGTSVQNRSTKDTAAGADGFAVAGGKISLPTDDGVGTFVITGERTITAGTSVQNRSDAFPKTVHLLVKALGFQVCEPDILRAIYIDIPSFQPSPDQNFQIATDATLDFTGDMQVSYCGNEGRELYSMYFPDDDIED